MKKAATIVLRVLALSLAAGSAAQAGPPVVYPGWSTVPADPARGRWVLGDGPGYGWGFPNGNPDGYGWFDHGVYLPLGPNRIADYYFPRYFAVPAPQAFLQSYYNPYLTRGQRYISYTGDGGDHPAGGWPMGSAETPANPYRETLGSGPRVRIPAFNGRIEAPPVNAGGSGLTP